MKYTPKTIVNLNITNPLLLLIIWWWETVAVIPEDKRTIVFKSGTSKGLIEFVPMGDQLRPTSMFGLTLASKKAQKKPKKNITSLKINKTIPYFSPSTTIGLWSPAWASLIISLNQTNIINNKTINLVNNP